MDYRNHLAPISGCPFDQFTSIPYCLPDLMNNFLKLIQQFENYGSHLQNTLWRQLQYCLKTTLASLLLDHLGGSLIHHGFRSCHLPYFHMLYPGRFVSTRHLRFPCPYLGRFGAAQPKKTSVTLTVCCQVVTPAISWQTDLYLSVIG